MGMISEAERTREVISQAESFEGIRAGIASLRDVLEGPSYSAPQGRRSDTQMDDASVDHWPVQARTVLVLGLHHPPHEPRLDYWEKGDTWGNRRLREISERLKGWFRKTYDLDAQPLPYHLEKGGLFLKDAAVLSGIGIIGRSNLLLHPEWGPRIRLRSILLEGEFQPTAPLDGFAPCESCEGYCQRACPVRAFPRGQYQRAICLEQINADVENKVPEGKVGENGKRGSVIKYCRACELSCPVGA